MGRFLLRAALLGALVGLSACGTARRRAGGEMVESIAFRGNGGALSGHNDYQLLSQMEQEDSPFGARIWPLSLVVEPSSLDRAALDRDAYRIEVWYAHNGWFDAQFLGWEVHTVRQGGRKRAPVVRIVGHVAPGAPSIVKSFEIEGLNTRALQVFGDTVKRTGYVAPGAQFSLESAEYTQAQLQGLLADHGYPYAKLDIEVDAHPEDHEVDVVLAVDPGPTAHIGTIDIEGLSVVERRIVEDTLTFHTGEAYDAAELSKSQQALFALGTFSVVAVEPDLSDRTNTEVPVTVRLTETRFQTLRAGAGADVDSGLVTPRFSGAYSHAYAFDRFLQTDANATLGYALGSAQQSARGATFVLGAQVRAPRLSGPKIQASASTQVERAIENNQYAYLKPEAALKLAYRANYWLAFDAGPSFEYFRLENPSFAELSPSQQDLLSAVFGRTFDGSYALLTADVGVTADWRDDVLSTTRGSYYRLLVRQSIPGILGDRFLYSDISADGRTYRRIRLGDRTPFTFAIRARARVLLPWNDAGTPYPEREFMGGSSDLRAFRVNQVGPYDVLCTYDAGRIPDTFSGLASETLATDELTRRYFPHGGEVAGLLSAEARVDWAYGISWAPFVDIGLLGDGFSAGDAVRPRGGVGLGFRYDSIVGPVRLDIAARPLFSEDTTTPTSYGCRVGDVQPRAYDLFSVSKKQRYGDTRDMPFAIVISLAIGQAF